MKYIVMGVLTKSGLDCEIPFVFPDLVVHLNMATVCKVLLEDQFKGADVRVISAGFINSIDVTSECYGKSESLGVTSRPEDTRLIKMCDYGSIYA